MKILVYFGIWRFNLILDKCIGLFFELVILFNYKIFLIYLKLFIY